MSKAHTNSQRLKQQVQGLHRKEQTSKRQQPNMTKQHTVRQDRGTPPEYTRAPPQAASQSLTPSKLPPAHHSPQPLPRMEEQPVTLGVRGLRSSQSPWEEESLPESQEQSATLGGRGPRSRQSPLEEEDQETASHPRRKRIQEHPDTIGTRDLPCSPSKVEMGRHQCKGKYNNMRNKTSPESSPPPTPRPEHCNVDKAEGNDLKNSLLEMIEDALEGKIKDTIKEIKEKTNKKLEEIKKEIKEKNKKIKEMNNEIEDKNKKWKE
ncbi:hypothetical protein STEG23_026748 [Scotinomys teguina]